MVLKDLKKKVMVVGLNEKEYTPKGSSEKKTLYNLGIVTETKETGMLRCSDLVAGKVRDDKFKLFSDHVIICQYNDNYDSFMVEDIE